MRAHPAEFLDALDHVFPTEEGDIASLDPDTFVSAGSREASYRAAGAVIAAVDSVLDGADRAAFCAVRPPGHHAEPAQPMGFCVFNNVVIGALHALHERGLARVAVVDLDVHHGNGGQTAAASEPRLFYASAHQAPLYPGTGRREERGSAGNILNVPLPAGTTGPAWRAALDAELWPALEAFAPDLLLVSIGFDGHADDPLAGWALTEADYAWAGARVGEIAGRVCRGKVVSTLEGGYDLAALERATIAYASAFDRAE